MPSATQKRPGEHLAQRGDRLGDDRGVVALPGRVDDPEGQRGAWQGGARASDQAKPDSPWRSLQGEKWSEDIAASKPASSAALDVGQQAARRDLLVGAVEADERHPLADTHAAPARSRPTSAPGGRATVREGEVTA